MKKTYRSSLVSFVWLLLVVIKAPSSPYIQETIAISYFDNNSRLPMYDPLKKGISDMLITDLSKVKGITIVERARLDMLLKEIKLGESKYFDPATTQKLGKGLGARFMLSGSFTVLGNSMRIDAHLIDVQSGAITTAEQITGETSKALELIKQLGRKVASILQVPPSPALTVLNQKEPNVALTALVAYSNAIELQDQGRNQEAEKILAKTVQEYPQFKVAKSKLDQMRKFLVLYDQKQQEIQQEKIRATLLQLNSSLAKLDPRQDNYADQIEAIWDLLFKAKKYRELLWFNLSIEKNYPKQLEERYLYNTIIAAQQLKEYDIYVPAAQKYLTQYPDNPMIGIVRTFYEVTLEEMETIEAGKVGLEEKIAKAVSRAKTEKEKLQLMTHVYHENSQFKEELATRKELLQYHTLLASEEEQELSSIFYCYLRLGKFTEARDVRKTLQEKYPTSKELKMMDMSLKGAPE